MKAGKLFALTLIGFLASGSRALAEGATNIRTYLITKLQLEQIREVEPNFLTGLELGNNQAIVIEKNEKAGPGKIDLLKSIEIRDLSFDDNVEPGGVASLGSWTEASSKVGSWTEMGKIGSWTESSSRVGTWTESANKK